MEDNKFVVEEKIDRTGYCPWCKHLPYESLSVASRDTDNKCFGCWCTENKPNWEAAEIGKTK